MCEAGRRNMFYAHPQRHKESEHPRVPVKPAERIKHKPAKVKVPA